MDLSFDPGSGVNGLVNAVAMQPDGKVIIGGAYISMVKGLVCQNIARLNGDGSGDSSFAYAGPNTGVSSVRAIALQSDGKVLVGHDNGLSRFNSDGSLDTNFIAPLIVADDLSTAGVNSVAVQADGRILIGGGFRIVNAQIRNSVARLNADGSLDSSFNPATIDGDYSGVFSIAVQSDGKVVIGGQFMTVNNDSVARLNADGSLDNANFFSVKPGETVRSVAVQPDGKVLIGGYFTGGIARLNANGSPDSGFNPGTGADRWIYSVALQADGKVLIGGDFTSVNGTNRDRIAHLNADGSLDSALDPGSDPHPYIFAIAVQSDGKVLIGGANIAGDVADYNLLARLNADGSLDSAFNPGTTFGRIVLQPDGKLLIGGYPTVNGTNRGGIARLNADWSLDSSFNPGTGALGWVELIALQSDGKVLIGGYFETVNGTNRPGLARLNSDGGLDSTFNPNLAPGSSVYSIAVQPDGKVLLGGNFSIVDVPNRYGIARLNADGSLDSSFNQGLPVVTSPSVDVYSIILQSDGKVLIGGYFTAVNGTNRGGIARLNADGSLNSTFNPGTGVTYGGVSSLALQPDGKVLIGGSYGIARLNANGSLDSSFPSTGANGFVRSIALQPDGKVLISGDFLTVNGVLRPHVARLYGDSVAPSLNIERSNAFVIVSWPVAGLNFQLQENTDLSLPNSWSPIAQSAVTNASQISVAVPTTVGRKLFRLKSQ